MKRRDFVSTGFLTALAGSIFTPGFITGCSTEKKTAQKGKAKNIIFLVSDGMSSGTLNMADLLMQRKFGKGSRWMNMYRENKMNRALMDTASANSMVTDSAAGSSSWGGGKRVNNSTLNVNPDGSFNKPILQKFKAVGKSVGCVTTVPITHATPAGFCVNMKSRSHQDRIASKYLELKFDVMMGGGLEYFNGKKREDKKNILEDFKAAGFQLVQNKSEMNAATSAKPVMGIFHEDGLPYSLDQQSNAQLQKQIPTLAEMAGKAISIMKDNPQGFVLQIEGGKVDWAAHANDTAALIYDQIAFDEAVATALDFAEGRDDTLVIITSDHGNSNPGLIKCKAVDQKFDTFQKAGQTNEWILHGIVKTDKPSRIIERINHAQGITITEDEAKEILSHYASLENDGLYNAYKLPFRKLAEIQNKYTAVGWSGMNHSADFVELGIFGPHSEALPPFVKNFELHNFMLEAAEMPELAKVEQPEG
jgi:alkaline phosphatase